jgi:photosystem II stability/assembly factor-like uncharacterized protein
MSLGASERVADKRSKGIRRRSKAGSARRSRYQWWVVGVLGVAAVVGLVLLVTSARSSTVGALATLQTGDFHALAFDPSDARIAFFGHHNGVLRTDDGGKTWRPLVERPNFDAMSIGISRADAQRLYLAGHDVLQASLDGGATWQPVPHNLPGTDIHAFAVSPENPDRLYALVVGQGAFRSSDGGRTWQSLGNGLPGDVTGLDSASGTPELLYASSGRMGVMRSSDGGASWSRTSTVPGSRGVLALAVDPIARETIYAGTEEGLSKSTDGGRSWSALSFPARNVMAIAVSPSDPNVVLTIAVENRRGLVFRSEDGGRTWVGR